VKTVATANWYGYTGTPLPAVVLDVEVDEVTDEEMGREDVELVETGVEEVELEEVIGEEVELVVVDADTVTTEEAEYSRTLLAAQSATQRLPLESNARP
jgi:hypothetical protein